MLINELVGDLFWFYGLLSLQALQNGFFNFETFDVDEYEHYEVHLKFVWSHFDYVICRYLIC